MNKNYQVSNGILITLAVLEIFISVVLFWKKSIKGEWLLTLSSILLCLFFFEFVLHFIFGHNYWGEQTRIMRAFMAGIRFDSRSIPEIAEAEEKKGKDAFQNLGSVSFWGIHSRKNLKYKDKRYIPLTNLSEKTIINCNENGKYHVYESDEIGFNNPMGDFLKANTLLIGDSYTQGACVDRESNFSNILKKHDLIANLGVGGNGPISNLAVIREFFPFLKAKNIIYFHFEGNDITDLKLELDDEIMNLYLSDAKFSQNYLIEKNNIDNALSASLKKELWEYQEKLNKSRSEQFLQLGIINYFLRKMLNPPKVLPESGKEKLDIKVEPKMLEAFEKTLLQMNDVVKRKGNLYFVYLPEYARYKVDYRNEYYNSVKEIVERNKIQFIDVTELFNQRKNPLEYFPYELNGHYNESGYEAVSNFVAKKIYKN